MENLQNNGKSGESKIKSLLTKLKNCEKFTSTLNGLIKSKELQGEKEDSTNYLREIVMRRESGFEVTAETRVNLIERTASSAIKPKNTLSSKLTKFSALSSTKSSNVFLVSNSSEKTVTKKIRSFNKRVQKSDGNVRVEDFVMYTRKYGIVAVLQHSEIVNNSHLSYMLNKSTLRIGEHLNCIVMSDLCKTKEYGLCACLSINNHYIAGKAQLPAEYLFKQDIDYGNIYKQFFVLGFSNGAANPQLENKTSSISSDLESVDYNMDKYLVRMQANPKIYFKMTEKLGILENQTLINYSNSDFFNERFDYKKLRSLQNRNWARSYYEKGISSAKRGNHEQAIKYFAYSLEYDRGIEDIYIAQAVSYSAIKKYEKAFENITKCLEINPENKQALLIKIDLEKFIEIEAQKLRKEQPNFQYGHVEISLKTSKRGTGFKTQDLLLDN